MKARAGPAGDHHKQHRKERFPFGRDPAGELGIFDLAAPLDCAHDHAQHATAQGQIEEIAPQVAARLQQQPHRNHRGHEAIAQQRDVPNPFGRCPLNVEYLLDVKRNLLADPNRHADQRQKDQRGPADRQPGIAQQQAHHDRQSQIEQRAGGHPAAGNLGSSAVVEFEGADKGAGRDVGKRHDDVDQAQPDEGQKQQIGPRAHVVANHFGNRAGVVPDRCHQRGEIVYPADQDRATQNPQPGRQPAKGHSGHDRTDDRTGGGNGREMLAEQKLRLDRGIVDVVAQRDRRRLGRWIQLQQPRQERPIRQIGHRQNNSGNRDNCQQCHRESPSTVRVGGPASDAQLSARPIKIYHGYRAGIRRATRRALPVPRTQNWRFGTAVLSRSNG